MYQKGDGIVCLAQDRAILMPFGTEDRESVFGFLRLTRPGPDMDPLKKGA